MNKVKLLSKDDLSFYLDCTKVEKWQSNAGIQHKIHPQLKIIKEKDKLKFQSKDMDTPLMIEPKILLECIDSFHQIIFQELVKELA
eukprot:COSAG01_NODE_2960_length_6792_cov_24.183573_4_plen_86_part_00